MTSPHSRRPPARGPALAALFLFACAADADDPAGAGSQAAAPDAAPDAHVEDAAPAADAALPDAALPDAAPAPVCGPLGRVEAALDVYMRPTGEAPTGQGLCMDGGLHRLDGRARVISVSPWVLSLQFPDTEPRMDAQLHGSFSHLALDAGAEVEAHVACYGASEIGGHGAAVLADDMGVVLSAGSGGWSFFAGGPWGVDAETFFAATPFTRAPRCTATSTVDCDHIEEALTFDLPGGPVTRSAGEESLVPGNTAGELRLRIGAAFEHFGPQPRCPFSVDGLAFQVARVRPFDGPRAACPVEARPSDAPPIVTVSADPPLPPLGVYTSIEWGIVVRAAAGEVVIDSELGVRPDGAPGRGITRVTVRSEFGDLGLRAGDAGMVSLGAWPREGAPAKQVVAVAGGAHDMPLVYLDTAHADQALCQQVAGVALRFGLGDTCPPNAPGVCSASHRLIVGTLDGAVDGMPGETISGHFYGNDLQSLRILRAELPIDAAGCLPASQAEGRVEVLLLRAPAPAGP